MLHACTTSHMFTQIWNIRNLHTFSVLNANHYKSLLNDILHCSNVTDIHVGCLKKGQEYFTEICFLPEYYIFIIL
jgi:hypothetical protein